MNLLSDGQIVRGTYEVERYLGEGSFAEVYRVRHKFLGRQAMKVFKRQGMTQAEVEEILGEAVLLSRIGHPNIVRVFDANVIETPQGLCGFFTMEYIPGGSLDRFWQSYGTTLIPVECTVDLMKQVCRGMSLAHAEDPPIIHRDLKPQNILVGYEVNGLRARVSDFGLAKSVNPLTLLATAAGTLTFKPPETFSTNKADSCAADVWALGVTMYLMLTDHLPFEINPELGFEDTKAFQKEIVPPSSLNIDVDRILESIVLTCLQIDQQDRYQDASELLYVLEDWRRPLETQASTATQSLSSEPSKSKLGVHSPVKNEEGTRLAQMAIAKAREEGQLFDAADIMEEAFNKAPFLRDKYAEQVRLWRCGISM